MKSASGTILLSGVPDAIFRRAQPKHNDASPPSASRSDLDGNQGDQIRALVNLTECQLEVFGSSPALGPAERPEGVVRRLVGDTGPSVRREGGRGNGA